MMAEKPSYEALQGKIRELEADKVHLSTQHDVLNNLFNLSPDMLCMADLDGYLRLVNPAFENTLGHSRQVLLETPFMEFVHPDDKAATTEAMMVLATGEPVAYFENRYRCSDGSYKWLAWTSAPTSEGHLHAIARDITPHKELQDHLKRQNDLLRTILSNVPAAVFWKDRDSVFLGANDQFARDAGLQSPDEFIGKTDYDFSWTREQSDFYRVCDRRVMDSGKPLLNIVETQQQADGREASLLTSKVPLLDASGQVYGMLGIYMDISRQIEAENTLKRSEARLQTLFDSANEYIFVIDPEGTIIQANGHVYEQSGYKEDEVLGKNIKTFFSEESKEVCDCNFPGLRERGYNRADIEFVCKDGRVVQMECSATAVPDENGEFTSFLIVQRDVTERKQAETDLVNSEKQFRTIFNSSFQLIGMLDPDGVLLDANQTALDAIGVRREDIIGMNFWDIYCWNYSTDVQNRLKAAINVASKGKSVRYEAELLTRGDVIKTIDLTLKPVLDQQGKAVLIIPEGRDISDIKRAEEETLRHYQDMSHVVRLSTAGEMASGMAHELNQPLTALVSYCDTAMSLLKTTPAAPQQVVEILERASRQAHRAGEIIRHLREFIGKSNNYKESLQIDKIIQSVIGFLKYEVQKSNVNIKFRPGCQACSVKVDKIQVEQVLINMVRNSLEAIRDSNISAGQVVIQSALSANDRVVVTVADNGPGIDARIADTLFDPFQTNKESGMGIGLSLSSAIIEAHEGKLWVDKDRQNGALFGFQLPVSQ
jgi:PAS domain S-box-containing protein